MHLVCQRSLVVVFRMVEVSEDQTAILGYEQFDYKEHTINEWLSITASASLAIDVEINGTQLFA